jgi:hypothetical protein
MPQDVVSLASVNSGIDEEFRRLQAEHHEYESRLSALLEKESLTEDELLEETTLKKKKLHLKDRMREIAAHQTHS